MNPTHRIYDQTEVPLDGVDPEFVHVWTDGGGNCGPASLGVVVVQNGRVSMTFGKHLGDNSSNNIAELQAIRWGLILAKGLKKSVRIYSDSYYAIHALSQVSRGVKNLALITKIHEEMKMYPHQIEFVKVRGHSELIFNEYADSIASWFLSAGIPKEKKTRKKREKK